MPESRQLTDKSIEEIKRTWKYFGLPFLLVGLIVIAIGSYMLQEGFIREPYGFMRLQDAGVKEHLSKFKNTSENDLKVQLKNILKENAQTILYEDKDTFTLSYKIAFHQLDQLVYARSISNTERNADRWTIHVLCNKHLKCLDDSKDHMGLFTIKSQYKAQETIALLHQLIKLKGGEATLDENKSITALLRKYQEK